MEQIRLTCGGCHKRYRLPGNATGYFRCRKCDLVMAIPTSRSARITAAKSSAAKSSRSACEQPDSVSALDESDELIDELAVDPETGDVIHVDSTTGMPAQPVRTVAAMAHVKRQASIQPSDAALLFIGAAMAIGGWLTMIMQWWPKDKSSEPGVIALSLGFLVGLTGVGLFAFGVRNRKGIQVATAVTGSILTIAMLGKGLLPEKSSEQTARNSIVDQNNRYDPGQSRFSLDERRQRDRNRTAKLDDIDRKLDNLRSTPSGHPARQPDPAGSNPNERSPESRADKDSPEDGSRSADREIAITSNHAVPATGLHAREIDRLWASTRPGTRTEILAEMNRVIRLGKDESPANEHSWWAMYESRLSSLKAFDTGKWVRLDFQHELAGWHFRDADSVHVMSPDTISIRPGQASESSAVLSTPDLFYGPLTTQATIQLEHGTGQPELGLIFSNGEDDESIGENDCAVMFDHKFHHLHAGSIASGPRELSLTEAESTLNSGAPVHLMINVCRGYVQVFANGNLLVERFDKSISEVHSMRLAVFGAPGSTAAFQVSDWKARRWQCGKPPGQNAYVEEDLMYFRDAVAEFPDNGWFQYRLAVAEYGTGKFRQAAETARQAEALGVPREELALIFGMELELDKRPEEAASVYAEMAAGPGRKLAQAWHTWLTLTSPDAGLRAVGSASDLSSDFFPERWVVNRIRAASAAHQGRFEEAARLLTSVSAEIPLEFRGESGKQLDNYQAGQAFLRSRGRLPFYHGLKVRVQPAKLHYDK